MEQQLKILLSENFPAYQINNATNRNSDELDKIINICHKIDSVLVFTLRTKKNEKTFRFLELFHNDRNIEVIFYFRDDYVYVKDLNDLDGTIRLIKKTMNNENECVVCYKDKFGDDNFDKKRGLVKEQFIVCNQCSSQICSSCINKMQQMNCPICRYELEMNSIEETMRRFINHQILDKLTNDYFKR